MIIEVTRDTLTQATRRAALVAFGAVLVFSPFRARVGLATERAVPVYGEYTDFLLYASDVAIVAVLLLWATAQALKWQRLVIAPTFLVVPGAALLGIGLIGVPFSVDPSLAFFSAIRLAALLALAMYVVNEVDGVRRLVVPVSIMVTVQAIVGVSQVLEQRSLGLGWLGERMLSPDGDVSIVVQDDGSSVLRAYGLADHPNILGGLLAFALIILIGGFVSARRAASPLPLVVAGLGGSALVLTFSRNALIAAVVGLVVVAGMVAAGPERDHLRRLGVAFVALAIAITPLTAPFRSAVAAAGETPRTLVVGGQSLNERDEVTDQTTELLIAHPLLGVGLGTLPVALREAAPTFPFDFQPAPSVLLDVTAETGALGGAAFLALLLAPWVAVARRRRIWTVEVATVLGVLAAMTIVGVRDHYTWSYQAGRIWVWIMLGLWAVEYRRARAGGSDVA